jgi:hypothetical protein
MERPSRLLTCSQKCSNLSLTRRLSPRQRCDSYSPVKDSAHSPITDKARLVSIISGGCFGLLAAWVRGPLGAWLVQLPPSNLQLLVILTLSLLAGFVSVVVAKKLPISRPFSPGEAGRLGILAGLVSALWAGGGLTLLATLTAGGAQTALLDRILRGQMWLVLAVSLAALLPGVLSGFVGGLMGSHIATHSKPKSEPPREVVRLPWLPWVHRGVVSLAVLAMASPFSILWKAGVVDPPPVVAAPEVKQSPPTPPRFQYDPPQDLKSARLGEIQPAFTKVIPNVQSSCPVALSPDGRMIAFGDSAGAGASVGVFDLHRFTKIASISVSDFPKGVLAWSPDQKSLSCTIGNGQARRIWILRISSGAAIELPRPPGRDVPGGDLYWWQDEELAFFPTDESPLAFGLQTLLFLPFDGSPAFKQLNEVNKQLWLEGPRTPWPEQSGWKFGLRPLIKSAVPPARRAPDGPWQLSSEWVCAFTHPNLPLAFGFRSLPVQEGDQLLCSPDGSKLIRLQDRSIEVTFMEKVVAPEFVFEVQMPFSLDGSEGDEVKRQIEEKQLCALVCAPLNNPLNNAIVGPNYNQVCALARVLEWKGRQGIIAVQTHDGGVQANDLASTLHLWQSGRMIEWRFGPEHGLHSVRVDRLQCRRH